MSRGNLIGSFVAVALAAAVSAPPPVGARQPSAVTLEMKDGKAKAEGRLTREDALDVKGRKESYGKAYAVKLDAGVYRIDALSKAFDTFLRLEDSSSGEQVAFDDDSGPEDSNARITFRTVKDGTYRVVVTSFNPGRVGAFTLLVTRLDAGKAARLALQDGRVSVEGKLTKEDAKDLVRNTPCKEYLVEMEAGKSYRIDHASKAFDAYLRLEDEGGKQLAFNDDGGEGTNSRIVFRPTKAGTYRVIPTTLNADATGAFTLSIEAAGIPRANRLVLKDIRASVEGTLTKNDPFDTVRQQSRCQAFTVDMQAGKSYRIDLMSKAFDCYLRLEDPDGKQVA